MLMGFALVGKRRLEIGELKVFIYRPGKTDRGLRSWHWIVAHIPRKLEGGEVSMTNPPSGRLEFNAESYSVDWLG
jgi:hypothetical protein